MQMKINEWTHLFKLDPAKHMSVKDLERVCTSGTDGIIVGGTDNVTLEGVLDLLSTIRKYPVPCIFEVSNMESITLGFDHYLIPMVMNSMEKKWMMDIHHEAIKQYKELIDWDEMFFEGYCILNEEAKAFQYTNCTLPDEEDVLAYAHMAEHVFHLPIFYVEYSGTYGNPELVGKVKQELDQTRLFYGGGIENVKQAQEMKQHADCIIVGNSLYTNLEEALQTVHAVKKNRSF